MDIKILVAKMTLEEKASLCSGAGFWTTQAIERLNIPSAMVSDGPHGLRKQEEGGDHVGLATSVKATCFPAACATAASFDTGLVKQMGEALGQSCQHEKVAILLGPGINIKRSPLCGRNFEYFSEDPYLTGEMATAMVRGVQSLNVGTSVKHFVANNQEHRRMSSDSLVEERTMREIYLPAFEAVVKGGQPWTIMCSYNRVNGVYASENKQYLTDILRDEWGFDGFVISDWGATVDRVKGIEAGMDLEMPSSGGVNDKKIVEAVKGDLLDEKKLDQTVERILTVLYRYFENAKPDTPMDLDEQHAFARKAAADCIVLLKNEGQVLPIGKDEEIAVIGLFAKNPRFQGGGSSHVNSHKVESLLDVLEGKQYTYAQGYDVSTETTDEELVQEAVSLAKRTKVAVVVVGLPDIIESEGYDRTHMRLPLNQENLIERIAAVNPRTVVVLYNGSPIEMPWLSKVTAVVEAYLGGQAVGGATHDVLFGIVNPSGRLPETFPHRLEENPSYLSYGGEEDRVLYGEGIFVGYRYYDKKKMDVLFPFGYGLSYTEFVYENLKISDYEIKDTDTVTVSVDVINIGDVFGKEVVQLYVGDAESTVLRPVRELKGFRKAGLKPGERKTVRFTLDKRSFAYWNEQIHDWCVETGEFTIEIGRNSRDIVLEDSIFVLGTKDPSQLKQKFTEDSILLDVIQDPYAAKYGNILAEKLMIGLGLESPSSDPVSRRMYEALIHSMPLRNLVTFSRGTFSREQLKTTIDQMNRD
ncbi:MAG: glycosyl hydrolase [Lentisphaerae bacterium]|nr:glycosyl hydrolase [Lentisphaerota bacterium]